jgi:hypothetical protein
MPYRIESIEVFVRDTPPGRMAFVIGKQKPGEPLKPPAKRRPRGIFVCRMMISDDRGRSSWGASGDRPSFGWLDKRKKFSSDQKYRRIRDLVLAARQVYLSQPNFKTPFDQWHRCHAEVQKLGRAADHESLTSSYASALMERALIDAVCRLEGKSVFEMLQQERLGLDMARVHPELKGIRFARLMPRRPLTEISIRHTVGLADPIVATDQPLEKRINDGEPETLEEYIRHDGLRYFKVKIAGDPESDLERLEKIWSVVARADEPVVTFDGNESATDIDAFAKFVEQFERRIPGLFQHTAFIEQPLTRALTHDPATAKTIRAISRKKQLVIDEADGNTTSFSRAFRIGYAGTSHKNCKGFLKSVMNHALCHHFEQTTGREAFQTGEDLSLMPLIPLHQDFAALAVLNIRHCERNGHHYAYGHRHLTKAEQSLALKHHDDLYTERRGELFLDIQQGKVSCQSLQQPGFGTSFEPDWKSMTPLDKWQVIW